MSTVKSKKLQVGTDATSSNNFTIYQPATPDGTLRIGVGNADSPTEVGRFDSNGYVATNAPSFYAYESVATSSNHQTWTKLAADTELWDTNNCYDTSNYRFTPNVEGYYLLSANYYMGNTSGSRTCRVLKNGSIEILRGSISDGVSGIGSGAALNGLVYANGTTDYFEFYMYHNAGSTISTNARSDLTYFCGHLVRAT